MIEVKHKAGYVVACRTDGAYPICYSVEYADHGGDPQAAERAAVEGLGRMARAA